MILNSLLSSDLCSILILRIILITVILLGILTNQHILFIKHVQEIRRSQFTLLTHLTLEFTCILKVRNSCLGIKLPVECGLKVKPNFRLLNIWLALLSLLDDLGIGWCFFDLSLLSW